MFGAFIVSCGFTHLLEVVTFYEPIYRVSGLVKLVTAIVSWATVLGLIPLIPRALALRSPAELEREITERRKAEDSLQQAHAELERRVQERTTELAETNRALQAEIVEREHAKAERESLLAREQRARADAEDANRTKDEFLATLSHELRTPLNAILGWVHLLRCGHLDANMTTRALDVLDRNARAQAQLIGDLLDVSRIVSGKLILDTKPVDLTGVVEAALDAVKPAATAREIELRLVVDAGRYLVPGDSTRMQQVVWNLLSNAVKFTSPHGWVSVHLGRPTAPSSPGGWIMLEISDNGAGIGADLLPHVFDRFRQGDSTSTRLHGGLGLGLAIVRHLVELHGGTVQVFSAGPEQGATFTVLLPLLKAKEPESQVSPFPQINWQQGAESVLSGLRLLVVDDEPDARDLLVMVLGRCGAQVTAAASAREALERLDQQLPDVLISDVSMPGEDGYTLLRQVRARPVARGGRVPAIALTALARPEDRTRALAAGFQIHTPKPIDPDELVTAVLSLSQWNGSDPR